MNSADHEVIRSGEEMEMSRQKKESKPLNIRMEAKLYDKLEQYCKDSRLPKTAAVELAVEEYLRRNEVKEVKP